MSKRNLNDLEEIDPPSKRKSVKIDVGKKHTLDSDEEETDDEQWGFR